MSAFELPIRVHVRLGLRLQGSPTLHTISTWRRTDIRMHSSIIVGLPDLVDRREVRSLRDRPEVPRLDCMQWTRAFRSTREN